MNKVGAPTAATAVIVAPPVEVPASGGRFEHPSEYLAAMQAVGWQHFAMFQQSDDGSADPMGVSENASEDLALKTWDKFHAIQMRMPAQRAADMPQGDWWKAVRQFLYDRELRDHVTPPDQKA